MKSNVIRYKDDWYYMDKKGVIYVWLKCDLKWEAVTINNLKDYIAIKAELKAKFKYGVNYYGMDE